MNQLPKREYIEFKNYLHNDLGITRDIIKKWVDEAIEKTVIKYIRNSEELKKEIDACARNTTRNEVRTILNKLVLKEEILGIITKEIGAGALRDMLIDKIRGMEMHVHF
ncbi:hypothetical protein M0R36_09990 [bacterium]|jgi:hypothetical protein|nr:hypothetical protein [bacterium]